MATLPRQTNGSIKLVNVWLQMQASQEFIRDLGKHDAIDVVAVRLEIHFRRNDDNREDIHSKELVDSRSVLAERANVLTLQRFTADEAIASYQQMLNNVADLFRRRDAVYLDELSRQATLILGNDAANRWLNQRADYRRETWSDLISTYDGYREALAAVRKQGRSTDRGLDIRSWRGFRTDGSGA